MEEILSKIQEASSKISFDNTEMDELLGSLHELGGEVAFQSALFSVQQSFSPLSISSIFSNLNSFVNPYNTEFSKAIVENFAPVFLQSQIAVSIWISKTLSIAILNLELCGMSTLGTFFASIEDPNYSFTFISDYFRQLYSISSCSTANAVQYSFFHEFFPANLSQLLAIFFQNADNNSFEFLSQALVCCQPTPMYILASTVGDEENAAMYQTQCNPQVTAAILEFYNLIIAQYSLTAFSAMEQRNRIIEFVYQTIPIMCSTGSEVLTACIGHIINCEKEDETYYTAGMLTQMIHKAVITEIIPEGTTEFLIAVATDAITKHDLSIISYVLSVFISLTPKLEEGTTIQLAIQIITSIITEGASLTDEECINLDECAENIAIIAEENPSQVIQAMAEIISQSSEALNGATFSLLISITNYLLRSVEDGVTEEMVEFAFGLVALDEFQIEDWGTLLFLRNMMELIIILNSIVMKMENQELLETLKTASGVRIGALLAYVSEGNGNQLELNPEILFDTIYLMCKLIRIFQFQITDDYIFSSITADVLQELGKGQNITDIVAAASSIDESVQLKVISNMVFGLLKSTPSRSLFTVAAAIKELVTNAISAGQAANAIRMTVKFPQLAVECITECAGAIEVFTGSIVKAAAIVGFRQYWPEESEELLSNFIEILCQKISLQDLNAAPRALLAEMFCKFFKGGGSPGEATTQIVLQWLFSIIERGEGEAFDSKETELAIFSSFADMPTSVIMSCEPTFFSAFVNYLLRNSSQDTRYLTYTKVLVDVINEVEDGSAFLGECLTAAIEGCFNAEELIKNAVESYDDEADYNVKEKYIVDVLRDISIIYNYSNRFC